MNMVKTKSKTKARTKTKTGNPDDEGVTNLDGVLEHGVVQLAEGEAKAAAHLGQADRELTNRRPGFFSIKLFLLVFSTKSTSGKHLEFRRAVSTGCRRDIVESSSGLHSLRRFDNSTSVERSALLTYNFGARTVYNICLQVDRGVDHLEVGGEGEGGDTSMSILSCWLLMLSSSSTLLSSSKPTRLLPPWSRELSWFKESREVLFGRGGL